MKIRCFLILLFVVHGLSAREHAHDPTPYLIPRDHYLRSILDTIFSNPNVLKNKTQLARGRFCTLCVRKKDKGSLRVVSHPSTPGYLFKLYLDDETSLSVLERKRALVKRCAMAEELRALIRLQGIRHFTIPEKWLYELPDKKKGFVLVVQDMQLAGYKGSQKAWKQVATEEHLNELYQILSEGYASISLVQNIPYTKINTFSCIDTEFSQRDFKLGRAARFFSSPMRKYWKKLQVKKKREKSDR